LTFAHNAFVRFAYVFNTVLTVALWHCFGDDTRASRNVEGTVRCNKHDWPTRNLRVAMGSRRNGWRASQHERHAESKAWGRQVERTGPAGNGGLGLDAAATVVRRRSYERL